MKTLLRGINVVEIGAVVMGPLAGQILADLGANVVKVEPLDGDIARASHPQIDAGGALFINNNRNKRSISIDLKNPQGATALARLIKRNDVLLHNMRTGAAERLGIGFEAVAALHPKIIYCSAIGFGQNGRYRNRAAYDDVIQAASGIAALARQIDGEPCFVPTILADKVAALHIVYGILAALVARERGVDHALRVEVPMFETLASFVLNEHLAGATFEETGDVGYARVLSPNRRPHRTLDGWIAVLPYTGEQWRRFLGEIGQAAICDQPWFANASTRQANLDMLYGVQAEALATRTTNDWLAALEALDVPCSQINDLQDLLDDPHLKDVDFFRVGPSFPTQYKRMLPQPVVFGGVSSEEDTPPPHLGENTREVLREAGYDDAEIDRLLADGVAREKCRMPSDSQEDDEGRKLGIQGQRA